MKQQHYAAMLSIALALFYAIAFARLTAVDLTFGDGGELTLAAATNGVAHPPGYPLWIVIAHLFTLIPAGPIPFRVGLFSALCHAAAIGLVCYTAFVLTRNLVASVFAGALLGCAPLFVTWSIQPEVFALNDLFAAALLLCAIVMVTQQWRWWLLILAGALLGLALANQQTIVAVVPVLAWAVWEKRRETGSQRSLATTLLAAVAAALLGFALPYMHTFAASQRELAWPFQTAHNFPQFLALISRHVYGSSSLVAYAPLRGGGVGPRVGATLLALWPVFFVTAIGAMFVQDRATGRLWIPAAWTCLFAFAFCAVADIDIGHANGYETFVRFSLMPLTLLAPYAAFALAGLQRALRRRRGLAQGAGVALVAIVVLIGIAYGNSRSLHDRHDARRMVDDMFKTLPHGAVLLMWDELFTESVPYFQAVEELRPDVKAVVMPLLQPNISPDYVRRIENEGVALGDVEDERPGTAARDAIVRANSKRLVYVAGISRFILSKTSYTAYKLGLTALVSAHAGARQIRSIYDRNAAAMSAPGFGDVSTAPANTAGLGPGLAAQYAAAFESMGAYAQAVGRTADSKKWLAQAARYAQPSI